MIICILEIKIHIDQEFVQRNKTKKLVKHTPLSKHAFQYYAKFISCKLKVREN